MTSRALGAARRGGDVYRFGLEVHLETGLPKNLEVGHGVTLPLSGWCFHRSVETLDVEIEGDGCVGVVKGHRFPREDVYRAQDDLNDPHAYSFKSGFWGLVDVPEPANPRAVRIGLKARLAGGAQARAELAQVRVIPGYERAHIPRLRPPSWGSEPLVAVCMATHRPDMAQFARQVESLNKQTFQNWVCLISDDCSPPETYFWMRQLVAQDPRYFVSRAPTRLGFYSNFERALRMVPEWIDIVLLSDQDDIWYPNKIATLISALDDGALLAYSDMRILDSDERVLTDTYWAGRKNNHTDLASLILANTVTGAASAFRRDLLDAVLPFPPRIGDAYHDHWIAVAALSTGRIAYVDRPLYGYVQHGANVLGHFAPRREESEITRFEQAVERSDPMVSGLLSRWSDIYFNDLLRVQVMARTLMLRAGNIVARDKGRVLRLIASLDESRSAKTWLKRRTEARDPENDVTLGAEDSLLAAVMWRERALNGSTAVPTDRTRAQVSREPVPGRAAKVLERARVMEQKIAPLTLEKRKDAPERVNLLIPTVDLRYVFGGYIGKFNLARRLAESGVNVRLVIVDYCEFQLEAWKNAFKEFDGLGDLLEHCDVFYGFDRSHPLRVSGRDTFIATTWWTAHIAHQAVSDLGGEEFVYLVQEYEPYTFPMGGFAAMADASYGFPHFAIFSTDLLRDHFRARRLGVFAAGSTKGYRRSMTFNNAITDIGLVRSAELNRSGPRRLLYYARPEQHAERNMFEVGFLALERAVRAGIFRGEWRFSGIGTVAHQDALPLAEDASLQLIQRQSLDTYRTVLRDHDLGLSLMHTPHPSLVPIEMASAGMLVVTSTFENKTAAALAEISPNLIGVDPTIEGVIEGLRSATERVDDFEARAAGAQVAWSRTWDEALNPRLMQRVLGFLARARPAS
jgi:glycosyltransferase involved in cell wall biosynthesis